MALVRPYCTVAAVQTECRNSDSDAAAIAKFEESINAASRAIDAHCRRDFLFHDHASALLSVPEHWCAQNRLLLPWPIITLTKITIDGDDLDADEYRVEAQQGSRGCILRDAAWLPGDSYEGEGLAREQTFPLPPEIKLTGTFGYTPAVSSPDSTPAPTLPGDIVHACTVIAALYSGELRKESVGPSGDRIATVMKAIPRDIWDILNRYQLAVT